MALHQIYIIRQTQRKYCHDVSVIRRADCWTDHKLFRTKVVLQVFNSNRRSSRRYRFAGYKLSDAKVRAAYNEFVVKRVAPL